MDLAVTDGKLWELQFRVSVHSIQIYQQTKARLCQCIYKQKRMKKQEMLVRHIMHDFPTICGRQKSVCIIAYGAAQSCELWQDVKMANSTDKRWTGDWFTIGLVLYIPAEEHLPFG